jgi:tetratricopeptide (TPR) repeat protein
VQFLAEVVSRIVEISGSRLIKMLSRELQGRHGLVAEDETSRIGGQRVTRYRYSHVLFQQYLYHDLSQGERMALHADVGDLIEELYAKATHEVNNELAYHFAEADEWDKALPYHLAAANRALEVGSYNTAFEFLETALENADKLPPDEASRAKLEILLTMGSVHQALKGFTHPDVEETFARSRELAQELQEDVPEAVASYGLWTLHLFRLDLAEARELAGVIKHMGESRDDALLKVIGFRALANSHYQDGSLAQTIENANTVLEYYETDKIGKYLRHLTYDPKVFALGLRAWAESVQGKVERARRSSAEMFAYADELKHPISTCVAHLCALKLQYNFEDTAAIQRHAEDIRALARVYGFPWYEAFGELFAVWVSAMQDPTSEGDEDPAALLERIYSTRVAPDGNLLIHSQFCRMITVVLLESGRFDEALAWTDKGIEVAEAHGETIYLAEIIRIRGTILLGKGDVDNAIAELKRSIVVARSNAHRLFELRARVSLCQALEQQDRPGADDLAELKALLATFPDSAGNVDIDRARSLV